MTVFCLITSENHCKGKNRKKIIHEWNNYLNISTIAHRTINYGSNQYVISVFFEIVQLLTSASILFATFKDE
jgi:hypothetical protein